MGVFRRVYPLVGADYSALRLCLHPSIARPYPPGMQQICHGHSISQFKYSSVHWPAPGLFKAMANDTWQFVSSETSYFRKQ